MNNRVLIHLQKSIVKFAKRWKRKENDNLEEHWQLDKGEGLMKPVTASRDMERDGKVGCCEYPERSVSRKEWMVIFLRG